ADANGDDLSSVALPPQLEVVDLALALQLLEERAPHRGIGVDVADVDGHQALPRGIAEQLDQRGVGVEDLARQGAAIETYGDAFEKRAVAALGLPRRAAPRGLLQSRSHRGGKAGEVVRMLED